jgi:hypothetical protein
MNSQKVHFSDSSCSMPVSRYDHTRQMNSRNVHFSDSSCTMPVSWYDHTRQMNSRNVHFSDSFCSMPVSQHKHACRVNTHVCFALCMLEYLIRMTYYTFNLYGPTILSGYLSSQVRKSIVLSSANIYFGFDACTSAAMQRVWPTYSSPVYATTVSTLRTDDQLWTTVMQPLLSPKLEHVCS